MKTSDMKLEGRQLTEEERCQELHNPGIWPYVARCVLVHEHRGEHVDRNGKRWSE